MFSYILQLEIGTKVEIAVLLVYRLSITKLERKPLVECFAFVVVM